MSACEAARKCQTGWQDERQEREENSMDEKKTAASDVEALVALLDGCTQAGDSRIKVDVVEGEEGKVTRQYHHGRCDIGSPWACGTAFDVLE